MAPRQVVAVLTALASPLVVRCSTNCPPPETEQILNGITAGLFKEGRMPPGATLDVGCKWGKWACFYAQQDPARAVVAMDPDVGNIERVRNNYNATHPNIETVVGFLGAADGELDASAVRAKGATISSGHSAVRSIDSLFRGRRLGFAHVDVEGNEIEAFKGALQVFARDRPVVSAEVHVHVNHTATSALVRLLREAGYVVQLVEEEVSVRHDGRNLLAFHSARVRELRGSPTLLMAKAAGLLVNVDEHSILEYAHPCCAPMGACCPTPQKASVADALAERNCCRRSMVARHYTRTTSVTTVAVGGAGMAPMRTWKLAQKTRWP